MDIWAAGCVIIELILSLQDKHQFSNCKKDTAETVTTDEVNIVKNIIFKSTSCYPLSPRGQIGQGKPEFDLLDSILSVLGQQDEDDLSFVSGDHTKEYVRKMQSKADTQKVDFMLEFPVLSDPTIGFILQKMLKFNPFSRWKAKTLLKLRVFNSVRDHSLEETPAYKVKIRCDKDGLFDYSDFKANSNTKDKLVLMLTDEVEKIQNWL